MTGLHAITRSKPRPTIGINLTWLDPGVVGGSEEYSIRLLRSVSDRTEKSLRFRVYCRESVLRHYPDLGDRFDVELMPVGQPGKAARVAIENSWMAVRSRSDDLVHHMGGVVPWVRSGNDVVTVYDLQPLEMPQNFGALKRWWLAASIPHSVRTSALVISPSAFTTSQLVSHLGVSPDKIRLVPFGFSNLGEEPELAESRVSQPQLSQSELSQAEMPELELQGKKLGRFLLYPAIAYRHKRHVDLLEALALLPANCGDIQLVFTGRPGPETPRLHQLAETLGIADRVVFAGRVTEVELVGLYRRALALVFPSAYEGFGNPCVEAMHHDCPIVASDAGSLPEVTGAAAIRVGVGDTSAWAAAIAELAGSPEARRRLVDAGRRQLLSFDSDVATDRLLGVYHEALG